MNSILVIQLKRLGDVILTTGALAALRKNYPDAHITLAVDRGCRDLTPAITDVNEIWIYDRSKSFGFWLKLFSYSFDLCIDFTGNDRSALITFLSRAERRCGFKSYRKLGIRSWVYTELCISPVRERHTVDHYFELIKMVNPASEGQQPHLEIPAPIFSSAEKLLEELSMPENYFVVHPGAARVEKVWEPDRWVEVIREISHRSGMVCLLTGGKDPGELKQVRRIREKLDGNTQVYSVAGKIDFLMTAAIISRSKLFLGVDTAAAHVAGVFERPEVVLFGPTNPYHWASRHKGAAVVRAGYDYPYEPENPREKGHSMNELSVQTVLKAVKAVM